MKVDKYLQYFWNTIKVLFEVLVNRFSKEQTLVGADCLVQWETDDEPFHCYLSFSNRPPTDEHFDDFGVLDEDVFYYCEDVKELISSMWKGHADGWRMRKIELVYATTI